MDSIRVGYCIDSFGIGGTELNAIRTLEHLDRDRFEMTVFHLHKDGPIRSRYEALRVRMVHLPISSLYSLNTAQQGLRLGRLLRQYQIRVVHTHDLYTNIFALPWARTLGACCTLASRRWLYEAPRPGLVRLNKWSYRFATRVLANSPSVAALLKEEEGIPACKVVDLPNFVDERAFTRVDAVSRCELRRKWNIPPAAFVVGTVARLAAVKNHSLLLRAAQKLDGDFHVVLIGEGPERSRLEALAHGLGIQSRVHFIGEIMSPINLHQFFDLSVLCSRSEGFPNSLLEALAAECPIVATAVGGIKDVVLDNISGLLVQTDDAEMLANRIRYVRENPAVGRRLALAGLARVRTDYRSSVVIARLAVLYKELAGRKAGRE
jgi:glycosyltransferase involved in cell wall biosynthesis